MTREPDDLDDLDELRLLRRVDWRFLLPTPDLGRVAYPAPRDAGLLEALRHVSGSVERAPVAELAGYDVVVVTAGARVLGEVVREAPPGSWVVAELPGRAAHAAARRLRRRGWPEAEAHWLWPDTARCREIVPLRAAAVRHALARRDPGARWRLRVRVARLIASTPLFPLAVSDAVLVARAPS